MNESSTSMLDQDQLLETLKAFENGDFTVRMRLKGNGVARDIAKTLNSLVEQNQRLNKDLQRLSKNVGKEGKISERASIGDVSGSWATCVDSVNSLIADLVKATAEVTRVIGAVAKGDLSQSMPLETDGRPVKGEFLRTAKIVNVMVDQLNSFASEVTRVAREVGTEGKLGGQAEVAKGYSYGAVDYIIKPVVPETLRSKVSVFIELSKRTAALRRKNVELEAAERALQERTQELAQRVEELARSNAELERFAYVASHDLKEPLRMVTSYTKLLAKRYKGKLDADADDFINYAVDGASRMEQLIHDLLLYSRVGIQELFFKPIDCELVLRRALANLQTATEETDAVITHDPLPTINADDTQLVQVFQNLVSNAIKFRCAASPRIHVSAKKEPKEWVFLVQDNGIGIEPQYSERIFVIFQRLHDRGEYPGNGVGLAICKKVVENQGGRIWLESQPGQGTTFYFTIPHGRGDRRSTAR